METYLGWRNGATYEAWQGLTASPLANAWWSRHALDVGAGQVAHELRTLVDSNIDIDWLSIACQLEQQGVEAEQPLELDDCTSAELTEDDLILEPYTDADLWLDIEEYNQC